MSRVSDYCKSKDRTTERERVGGGEKKGGEGERWRGARKRERKGGERGRERQTEIETGRE